MRLLLVGNKTALVSLLPRIFAGSPFTVTRCADSSRAIAELLASEGKYDWIILGSRELLREGGRIADAAKALGLSVPIAFLDPEESAEPALSLLYAARKAAYGFQFLRFALSRPDIVQISRQNHGGEEVIFEYQAPCRREMTSSPPILLIRTPA